MKIKNTIKILFCVVLATYTVSCKQTQSIISSGNKSISLNKLLRKVDEKTVDFNTLEGKRASIDIETEDKKQSLRANFKLKKDSSLIIMANKTAIPVGRIKIEPDSFKLVYYIDKKVYYGSVQAIASRLGLNLTFGNIEAFISGNISSFANAEELKTIKDLKVYSENGDYVLQSIKKRKLRKFRTDEVKLKRFSDRYEERIINQKIYINPTTFLVNKVVLEDPVDNSKFIAKIISYQNIDDQYFPNEYEGSLYQKDKLKVRLGIKLSKIIVDETPNFHFYIPSKYEKIEFE